MISIVIPTMLIPDGVEERIRTWAKSPFVKEVIVINNTSKKIDFTDEPKIVYIYEGKNTYINPAWNKGYMLSTSDKICFANDDIDFDVDIFEWIEPLITPEVGMIGLDEYHGHGVWEDEPGCDRSRPTDKRGKRFPFKLLPIQHRRKPGFACIWFIHKSNYKWIPDDLKVFFGDDYVYYENGKQNYSIQNFDIVGKVGQTTIKPEINSFMATDAICWGKYDRKLRRR